MIYIKKFFKENARTHMSYCDYNCIRSHLLKYPFNSLYVLNWKYFFFSLEVRFLLSMKDYELDQPIYRNAFFTDLSILDKRITPIFSEYIEKIIYMYTAVMLSLSRRDIPSNWITNVLCKVIHFYSVLYCSQN